jgi:hypothetical protein
MEQNRLVLLAQIERLLTEVLRLQTILASRNSETTAARSTSYTPYQATFFPLSFESIYLVKELSLFNTNKNQNGEVRKVDKQMFDLFSKVIGSREVSKYVQEWRIFNSSSRDLGAFVELISGTNKWVVGANRESFSMSDMQIVNSFANLFVHEYAHIKFFEKPEFEEQFSLSFWNDNDLSHAAKVEDTFDNQRFDVLSAYFDKNKNRFVSDYATLSPDEDMAETFVYFVREARPTGGNLREQKILFFYEDEELVNLRTELRSNLRNQGLLR